MHTMNATASVILDVTTMVIVVIFLGIREYRNLSPIEFNDSLGQFVWMRFEMLGKVIEREATTTSCAACGAGESTKHVGADAESPRFKPFASVGKRLRGDAREVRLNDFVYGVTFWHRFIAERSAKDSREGRARGGYSGPDSRPSLVELLSATLRV